MTAYCDQSRQQFQHWNMSQGDLLRAWRGGAHLEFDHHQSVRANLCWRRMGERRPRCCRF